MPHLELVSGSLRCPLKFQTNRLVTNQLRVSPGPSGRRDAKKVLKNTHTVLTSEGLACCSSWKACCSVGAVSDSFVLPPFSPYQNKGYLVKENFRNALEKFRSQTVFVAEMSLFEYKFFQVAPDTKSKTQAVHWQYWLTHTSVQKHCPGQPSSTRSGELHIHT